MNSSQDGILGVATSLTAASLRISYPLAPAA